MIKFSKINSPKTEYSSQKHPWRNSVLKMKQTVQLSISLSAVTGRGVNWNRLNGDKKTQKSGKSVFQSNLNLWSNTNKTAFTASLILNFSLIFKNIAFLFGWPTILLLIIQRRNQKRLYSAAYS